MMATVVNSSYIAISIKSNNNVCVISYKYFNNDRHFDSKTMLLVESNSNK